MGNKRFDYFSESHIGFGIRWRMHTLFWIEISISIPFVTFVIGIGKEVEDGGR
jgi:hypothetical protein